MRGEAREDRRISSNFLTGKNSSFASQVVLVGLILLTNVNGFIRLGTVGDLVALSLVAVGRFSGAQKVLHTALLVFFLQTVHRFLPTFLRDLPATTFLVPFVVSTLLILPFPTIRVRAGTGRIGVPILARV